MTPTTGQKRRRSLHEESDCLPVTKKLNKLRIDGMEITNGHANHSFQNGHSSGNESKLSGDGPNSNQTHYSPELTSEQNPIYYETNKLLFEAHQMRLNRTSKR